MIEFRSKKSRVFGIIGVFIISIIALFFWLFISVPPDSICEFYLEDYPVKSWQSYTDKTNTVQFKYPSNWQIEELEKGANFKYHDNSYKYETLDMLFYEDVSYPPKDLEPGSKEAIINGRVAILGPDYQPIPEEVSSYGNWVRSVYFKDPSAAFHFFSPSKNGLNSYNCVFDEIFLSIKKLK